MEEFNWIEVQDDDFTCEKGEYILRVEQMDEGKWWWRVYHNGHAVSFTDNEMTTSKHRAFGLAEGLYMGHSLRN